MTEQKIYKDIDQEILKSIPNPDKRAYEIKIKNSEAYLFRCTQATRFLLRFFSYFTLKTKS